MTGPSGDLEKVSMYKYKTVADSEVIWAAFLADQTFADDALIEYTDGKQSFQSNAISKVAIKGGKVNSIQVAQVQ